MGDHQPRDRSKQRGAATAGPSADDRFGPGVIGTDMQARILAVSVSGERTRVTMSLGTIQGVRVGMEGYIKAAGGMLSELQIDAVEDRRCQAFVQVTPDELKDHRLVMLNPTSMPKRTITRDVGARIIGVSVENGRTKIIIAQGSTHGVTVGMRGNVATADGRQGDEFTIEGTTARQSYAFVVGTVDQVQQHGNVVLHPARAGRGAPIQRRANGGAASSVDVQATAQAGVAGATSRLPHFDTIQRAFGKHDISGVRAQVGGAATEAAGALGAQAYATGDKVAFASAPDLHTAAHEAAHAVQQRSGVVGFQGLGAADDEHERHADLVADAVVAGQSAEPLLDALSAGTRTGPSADVVQRKPDPTMDQAPRAPKLAPAASPPHGSHGSHEIKVEFGGGSITGGITATLEYGKVGTPVGADQLKALKNTASLQINGFATKLETAVLNGEAELDVLDGVKISVEANLMNVGSDGAEVETDLLQITLKLVGDVGHWLKAGPNVVLTIDGRISIALGGKLAAKLAKITAAQLEQKFLVKEMRTVGSAMDNHLRAINKLEQQLLSSELSHQVRGQIKEEILQHRLQLSTGKQQLSGLVKRLDAAKHKANAAVQKLKGKLVQQVARAMQRKTIAFVATKLAKLVPVLNAISMIVDVVDLIGKIRALIKGGPRGDGGEQEKPRPAGNAADGEPAKNPAPAPDRRRQQGSQRAPRAPTEQKEIDAARGSLSPVARRVITTVTHRGFSNGPELDADQITALGASIPANLRPEEVDAIVTMLGEDQTKARTAEDVFAAVNAAVRRVRAPRRSVTVDGVNRPDLAGDETKGDGPTMEPSGTEGPIMQPGQVGGGGDGKGPIVSDAMAIVQTLPPSVAGQWFNVESGSLALNDAGRQWIAKHENQMISARTRLVATKFTIRPTGANVWSLAVTFEVQVVGHTTRRPVVHRFSVSRDAPVLGVKVGDLAFEPYVIVGE